MRQCLSTVHCVVYRIGYKYCVIFYIYCSMNVFATGMNTSVRCEEVISHAVAEETLMSFGEGRDHSLFCVETICAINRPEDRVTTTVSFKIHYKKQGEETGTDLQHFIGKLNPRNLNFPALNAIVRHDYIMNALVPTYVLSQINKTLGNSNMVRFPKLYYSNLMQGEETLVLEDVTKDGYKQHEYSKTMNESHVDLIMEVLARLHAGSYVLEKEVGKSLEEQFQIFEPVNYIDQNYPFLKYAVEGYVESNALLMKTMAKFNTNPAWDRNLDHPKIIKWIREKKPTVFDDFIDAFKPSKPKDPPSKPKDPTFKAVIHGNLYGSQIHFKYKPEDEDCNKPLDACLSGFNGSKLGSPAVDINFFLYTSVDADFRTANLKELLKRYYNAYKKILTKKKIDMPFTEEQLIAEVKSKMIVGWYAGMNVLPAYLGREAYAPNMEDFNEVTLHRFITDNREKLKQLAKTNIVFASRYVDMYKSLIEYGTIE